MKPLSVIRLGFIGAGDIVRTRHLPGFRKIPGVRLVAVCNRSETSSFQTAREWGIERVVHDPMEIIRAPDIDAVIIGTWPYLHQPLSCAALATGKHVFTQARMARNAAEAREMLAAAHRHPRQVAMICASPYALKCNLFVQELLRKHYVGAIRLVRFHSLHSAVADPSAPIHWRQQAELSGFNTLSLGIILERFLQWFGPVTWIQASGSIFTPHRPNANGKRVPVTVNDQLLVTAQLRDHPGQLHLTFSGAVRHAPLDRVEIYGDRGTLVVELAKDEVFGAKSKEKKLRRLPTPKLLQREWSMEKDFIDAIRAGGRRRLTHERTRFFPPDFEEGLRYMILTEAAVRSAKTGRRVRIPATD
jgi:predicted dehydrogenase